MATGPGSPANPGHANRATGRTHPFHTAARTSAAALASLLMTLSVGAENPPRATRALLRQAQRQGPHAMGDLPYKATDNLWAGFRTALHRVHSLGTCQELFARLGADGLEVLAGTTYAMADEDWQQQVCRSAEAFTTVGSSQVWLCGSFSWITEEDAAAVLLHEALHSAGLGEQPGDPGGPTPSEIDRMVAASCGF